jgi:hypothetical protein
MSDFEVIECFLANVRKRRVRKKYKLAAGTALMLVKTPGFTYFISLRSERIHG